MEIEKYKQMLEEALTTPLDSDDPEHLCRQVAVVESLSYLAIKLQAEAENRQAVADRAVREAGKKIKELSGTAVEKKILFDAICAPLYEESDKAKADSRYWYGIGKSIEKKTSLAQSMLSHITASMKTGIRA